MSDADVHAGGRTAGAEAEEPWRVGTWRVARRDEEELGILSVLPVALVYTVAWIVPMLFAVYASLYDIPLTSRDWEFVWFRNYRILLGMEPFWSALWRGIVFATGSTILQLGVGIWLALLLNRIQQKGWFGRRIYATLAFTTFLVPTIVLTILVLFLFDLFVGFFHIAGSKWFGLWSYRDYIVTNRGVGMPLIIAVNSWKYAGFVALFTLAQRRSIPRTYFEAAKSFGATTWQMFRDVTYPRLRGVIALLALFRFVFTFNQYDIIRLLTAGGPGSETTTLPILAYGVAFGLGEYGLGNALAVAMFLVLLAGSLLYFVIVRPSREVETER